MTTFKTTEGDEIVTAWNGIVWIATEGDYDDGCFVGQGPTEADAIAELLEHLHERETGERPTEFREALAKARGDA